MSTDYNSFAAAAFGPVLAEAATDEGTGLTEELRQRAAQAWNLTPSALRAVYAEAERILTRAGN